MTSYSTNLYSCDEVRRLDQLAIEGKQIPGYTLMKRAGLVVFNALQDHWPHAKKIALFCGTGNNGGDGYVVARLAHEAGLYVSVFQCGDSTRIQNDAQTAYQQAQESGVQINPFDSNIDLSHYDVIIDAILGTGFQGELADNLASAIQHMNAAKHPIISIDCPSGLVGNSGHAQQDVVNAAVTVTFVGLKRGLFTGLGREVSGTLVFDDLSIPEDVYQEVVPSCYRLNFEQLLSTLPKRERNAHKGHFGHVLVVGGDFGMGGAACMAGEAAGRVGAGLISVATQPEHAWAMSMVRPELMSQGVKSAADLAKLIERVTVVAVGPGLGQSEWGQELWQQILQCDKPLVVDADALNLLAKRPIARDNWILTPHPGEAARLLACSVQEIERDRFAAVEKLQKQFKGVAVLKGAGTLVRGNLPTTSVCDAGNPGMATGGMGDVLTGTIAGLLAQGLSLYESACLGVTVHALAGDKAAEKGERGTRPTDLLDEIRYLLNQEGDGSDPH